MRCYNKTNKENFIEKYGLAGGYLYTLNGDKHIEVEQYSISREKEILTKMRKQVLEAKEKSYIDMETKYNLGHALGYLVCEGSFANELLNNNAGAGTYFASGLALILLLVKLGNLSSLFFDAYDLKKNTYFLNNECHFEIFNKNNLNHLTHVSGKAKSKINATEVVNPLNINFIGNISMTDLEKINENIICESKTFAKRKED